MNAEILAIGSEMLTPHRQDTNSLFLTSGLNDLGVSVDFKTIVGDNRAQLTAAIRIALSRADIVVLSGGLGPTEDDLTRECTAEALSLALHREETILRSLEDRFAARGIAMSGNNAKQADVIAGAEVLPNAQGSAPGQFLDVAYAASAGAETFRKLVLLLPGPPKELKALFETEARPRFAAVLPHAYLARRVLRMALIPESTVDARTSPIYKEFPDVDTTILAGSGEIQLHFVCTKPSQLEAESRVEEVSELVAREMGDDIFSSDNESLEEVVLLMLGLREETLSLAESCTGGWLGQRLTAVPNASRVFLGGCVCYTNETKTLFTGVPPETLADHGAVSEPVARLLAEGIRARTGSTLGLAITGLAGPAGGSGADAGKPVGLVYLALSDGEDTQVKRVQLSGDRDRIRLFSVMHAMELLRHHLQ